MFKTKLVYNKYSNFKSLLLSIRENNCSSMEVLCECLVKNGKLRLHRNSYGYFICFNYDYMCISKIDISTIKVESDLLKCFIECYRMYCRNCKDEYNKYLSLNYNKFEESILFNYYKANSTLIYANVGDKVVNVTSDFKRKLYLGVGENENKLSLTTEVLSTINNGKDLIYLMTSLVSVTNYTRDQVTSYIKNNKDEILSMYSFTNKKE